LMSFFRREGLHYLQFIPAMAFQSTEPLRPASYLIAPQEYGTFLTNIFDEWYTGGVPILSIRTFDNFLQSYLGVANDLCIHSSTCDAGVVVEYNGDIYPCDFYIHPQWRLGNISEKSLQEMVANPAFRRFTCQKSPLPVACQPCRWQKFCKSECFRNRQAATGVSYFCPAYREFFEYAHERLATLGERLASYRRYLQWLNTSPGRKAHRNDACPCGSGRKFKNCCGDPALAGSYLFQPDCGRVP